MIVYKIYGGKVVLNVSSPDEVGIIEIIDEDNNENSNLIMELLTAAFKDGWHGMHGNLQSLSTTAMDLNYAAQCHKFFSYLKPVLIEGQEILDAFEYRDDVMY
jgi:hypothetical protein